MAPTLRPYQDKSVSAIEAAWARGERRVAGVAATGAGKTVMLSDLVRRYRETGDPRPVLILAHRKELLSQAEERLTDANPGVRVGWIQGTKFQVSAPIIVASVWSLAPKKTATSRRKWSRLPEFGLVIVDECHRSMSPEYLRTLEALGCLRPDGPLTAGFTATFTREDKARLTDFWESVAFSVDILDLISWGYLVEPRFRRVMVEGLDLKQIGTSRLGGATDLSGTELAEAMERAGAPGVVAEAYRRHAGSRQGIVFTPDVRSAELVAQAFNDLGIKAVAIDGQNRDRDKLVKQYRKGEIQVVVNCAIFGEGFDAPTTKCVVIARPTMSKILFRQQVGRGLRLAPETGFNDCLVLDLVGATGRNDLATLDDLSGSEPVHVREGEGLMEAVKRERAARAELVGDSTVSGSLATVEVDPWEAERRSKLTKQERQEEDAQRAAESGEEPPPDEPEQRARYATVEHRQGWFLRSPRRGAWFIPLTTGDEKQRGAVVLHAVPGGLEVLIGMKGLGVHSGGIWPRVEDALEAAMKGCLQLLTTGVERSVCDPDSRWRRRRAGWKQIAMARNLIPWADIPDDAYAGQVADWLALHSHGQLADTFIDQHTGRATNTEH